MELKRDDLNNKASQFISIQIEQLSGGESGGFVAMSGEGYNDLRSSI